MMNRYRPPGIIESRPTTDPKAFHNSRGNPAQPSRVIPQRSLLPHELRQFKVQSGNAGVLQRQAGRNSSLPIAPPVYRPSRVLQPKNALIQKVPSPKAATSPTAPAVYNPKTAKSLPPSNLNVQNRKTGTLASATRDQIQRTLQSKTCARAKTAFNGSPGGPKRMQKPTDNSNSGNLLQRMIALPVASANRLTPLPLVFRRENVLQMTRWKWDEVRQSWQLLGTQDRNAPPPKPPPRPGSDDGEIYDDSPRNREASRAAYSERVNREIEEKNRVNEHRFEEKEKVREKAEADLDEKYKGGHEDVGEEIPIIFRVNGREEKVRSGLINKEFMRKTYEYAQISALTETHHYFVSQGPGTQPQHFAVRRGHEGDFVTFALKPTDVSAGVFSQDTSTGPDYNAAAQIADGIVDSLVKTGKFTLKEARLRVARDIIRLAGGKTPRIPIVRSNFTGKGGMAALAAMTRSDKARAPRATEYIESVLCDTSKSFKEKYGSRNPIYIGTGKGPLPGGGKRGPEGLRAKAAAAGEEAAFSDYSSDEEKKRPKRKRRRLG